MQREIEYYCTICVCPAQHFSMCRDCQKLICDDCTPVS